MSPLDDHWATALNMHLGNLLARGLSPRTIDERERVLAAAARWFDGRGRRSPRAVDRADVEAYAHDLARGGTRCPATCRNHLTALRVMFRDLRRRGVVETDPSDGLELPPPSRALPPAILGSLDLTALRRAAYRTGRNRLRNRAIVELLYATGVRRNECVTLRIGDVDFQRESLFVRNGKGRRQRHLPVARRALRWIAAYLRRERRLARRELDAQAPLFAGRKGAAMSAGNLTGLTRAWMLRARLQHAGACHLFRHSMATHMLDHGADVRHIQAMLGHADISTTMRYTQVSIRGLAEVYRRTHPAALYDDPDPST